MHEIIICRSSAVCFTASYTATVVAGVCVCAFVCSLNTLRSHIMLYMLLDYYYSMMVGLVSHKYTVVQLQSSFTSPISPSSFFICHSSQLERNGWQIKRKELRVEITLRSQSLCCFRSLPKGKIHHLAEICVYPAKLGTFLIILLLSVHFLLVVVVVSANNAFQWTHNRNRKSGIRLHDKHRGRRGKKCWDSWIWFPLWVQRLFFHPLQIESLYWRAFNSLAMFTSRLASSS